MDDYNGRHFILGEGQYDITPNPVPITKRLVEHGLQKNGKYQKLDQITIYPMDYFCPFNPYRNGEDCFTENTYANHHFNGEWKKVSNKKEQKYIKKEDRYKRFFGEKWGGRLCRNIVRIKYMGIIEWCKRYIVVDRNRKQMRILYNDNGFKKEDDAKKFIISLENKKAIVSEIKKTKQKENAPSFL